jgi:adenine-specific DNA-methyltransferase
LRRYEDEGERRYILVEMAEYFDTVLKPRILKVVYSKDWKDGKPVSRDGVSHLLKYIRLESYEDTLNNLRLERTPDQASLLEEHAELREDYTLHYMLDVESRDSGSLLDVGRFEDPFAYTLEIASGTVGETKAQTVDLVETFNYILGLRVRRVDASGAFRVVQGVAPTGEKVLVIWRSIRAHATRAEADAALDAFFQARKYNAANQDFDLVYVNGDNHLENLRPASHTWRVRLVEEEFQRLMFDVRDVL